jgi:hypothetical protein
MAALNNTESLEMRYSNLSSHLEDRLDAFLNCLACTCACSEWPTVVLAHLIVILLKAVSSCFPSRRRPTYKRGPCSSITGAGCGGHDSSLVERWLGCS